MLPSGAKADRDQAILRRVSNLILIPLTGLMVRIKLVPRADRK